MQEDFVDAPYVHPFNAPKYHAQQLRTLAYAKRRKKRLLWIVATDVFREKAQGREKEGQEEWKERLLQYHDRATGGIMGLLPLVLDMPIRFTESLNRDYGVYKHSRGWIRGWKLTDAEEQRLAHSEDPEIVLLEPPAAEASFVVTIRWTVDAQVPFCNH